MSEPPSTADYRKYPKGPNFGLIVVLFCATILVGSVVAYFLLKTDGRKLLPGKYAPHPNSQVIQLPTSFAA